MTIPFAVVNIIWLFYRKGWHKIAINVSLYKMLFWIISQISYEMSHISLIALDSRRLV